MAFSQEIADSICAELAAGKSLRAVCREPGMPSPQSVLRWIDADPIFAEQYTRARTAGYHLLADEIIEISDDECTMVRRDKHGPKDAEGDGMTEVVFDATAVARNRLRVDSRKWMLSKMLPKIYGDKLDLNHSGYIKSAKELSEDELARIASSGGA
jgi:hypothetical protein